jgi:hypothetical protein
MKPSQPLFLDHMAIRKSQQGSGHRDVFCRIVCGVPRHRHSSGIKVIPETTPLFRFLSPLFLKQAAVK